MRTVQPLPAFFYVIWGGGSVYYTIGVLFCFLSRMHVFELPSLYGREGVGVLDGCLQRWICTRWDRLALTAVYVILHSRPRANPEPPIHVDIRLVLPKRAELPDASSTPQLQSERRSCETWLVWR